MHDFGSDTLNGWKEIASFLGKSVRSAQRWEAELGLPVHRIITPEGGPVIYASRREIEVWRSEIEARRPEVGNGHANAASDDLPTALETPAATPVPPEASVAPAPPAPVPPTAVAPPAAARWVHLLAGLTILNLAILACTAWLAWPVPLIPARFELHGTTFRAMSASERVVWQHDFRGHVQPSNQFRGPQIVQTDLDGDGTSEVVAVVRVDAAGPGLTQSDRVVAFRRDGRLLWTVQPTQEVRDRERNYTGPWIARAMAVSGGRVAVAFSHRAWRPNFVLEIDAKGGSRVRYLHGGWVQGLAYWPTPRGLVLAIGGETTDLSAASVALIDADGPGGRPPALPERELTCDGCPTAPVRQLYLFPTGDVSRALFRPSGWVYRLTPQGRDLAIWIDAGLSEGAVAFMAPDGRIREYSAADRYWEAHRQMFDDRRLDHPVEACPERTKPVLIRHWTPQTQWTEHIVSTVPAGTSP